MVHSAWSWRGYKHVLNCLRLEIRGKLATIERCNLEKLVDYVGYKLMHTRLLEQFRVGGSLEQNTGRVESNRSVWC